MKTRDEIPEHTGCKNCGACCGPVLATPKEIEEIKSYVSKLPSRYKKNLQRQKKLKGELECPFRDNEKQCCAIYPVRPAICRLMGVTKGMECANGNSQEINGLDYIDLSTPPIPFPDML